MKKSKIIKEINWNLLQLHKWCSNLLKLIIFSKSGKANFFQEREMKERSSGIFYIIIFTTVLKWK